tara:strand:+ start:1343 stop:1546 length:204 start_codon:yes stop_codon:yes gene_type:complete
LNDSETSTVDATLEVSEPVLEAGDEGLAPNGMLATRATRRPGGVGAPPTLAGDDARELPASSIGKSQ